ncbi:MAG: hypothetical protein CMA97_06165 [Euryarchaeota archaeon]|nr:hypothetical protein [Euryarchaeota archaeon]
MGLAFDAVGFLLILASIPLTFGIYKLVTKDDSLQIKTFLGEKASKYAMIGLLLLLLVPYGAILLLPLILVLSFVSPAGRMDWSEHRNQRLVAVFLVFIMIGISGFMPIETPRSPEEWGEPFATENPYAPAWPASEQYTWVFVEMSNPRNVEVVQSLTIRTPHQTNPFQQVESSILISTLLDMQESRMRQAIDLVDERVIFPIDSEAFRLDQKGDAQSHTFRPSTGNVELNVWVYDCYTTSGTNPDGTKVGEIVVTGQSNWGGMAELIVIVRPISHEGLVSDPYAESFVNTWLNEQF